MKIITTAHQKGGAGKSTFLINLAAAMAEAGKSVGMLDTDPQGTVAKWFARRPDKYDYPAVESIPASALQEAIRKVAAIGLDYLLIDTPGRDELTVNTATAAADYVVVPCSPSVADVEAVFATVEVLKRQNKPFGFLIANAPPRNQAGRSSEAERALSAYGPVLPGRQTRRAVYQDAMITGMGVVEYEPSGKAADECRAILRKLEKIVGGING